MLKKDGSAPRNIFSFSSLCALELHMVTNDSETSSTVGTAGRQRAKLCETLYIDRYI